MNSEVRRGFVPEDVRDFNPENILKLKKAQKDILYLMERGYPIKNASTFVGNHYMLSERQRLAIVRATSVKEELRIREEKRITIYKDHPLPIVYIDGLNIIITLEVALSGSTLFCCMDGTIRDLAGLRGTYRLIDKTDLAIKLIGDTLEEAKIAKVVFYLDAPVSNTGRLKQRIYELMNEYSFEVTVELHNNVDTLLEQSSNVITSDAIILNKCESWINLARTMIDQRLTNVNCVDLSGS